MVLHQQGVVELPDRAMGQEQGCTYSMASSNSGAVLVLAKIAPVMDAKPANPTPKLPKNPKETGAASPPHVIPVG